MSDSISPRGANDQPLAQPLLTPIKRRSFFTYTGAAAGATALVLAGCSDDSESVTISPLPAGNTQNTDGTISLGSGDVGVLNYAYALEQLEADFYARAALTTGVLAAGELAYFQQIARHEAIHRDFLKAAISRDAGTQLLRNLTPVYPVGTFTSRITLLATARAFEDLGVAAYNGAGKLLRAAAYLVIAGQLVSVEARHAAYVRDLLTPGSFADDVQVSSAGLDMTMTPIQVVTTVQPFITEKLDASFVGVNR